MRVGGTFRVENHEDGQVFEHEGVYLDRRWGDWLDRYQRALVGGGAVTPTSAR